jgi:putative transcriptional regulator
MKDELFDELIASVHEGGKILRGKAKPSRTFIIETPNVKKIRSNYKLSQIEFAALMGISVKTLRNWEQGRRAPEGAARVLLQVAAKHPEVIWDVVRVKAKAA